MKWQCSNGKSNQKRVQRALSFLKMKNSVPDYHPRLQLIFMRMVSLISQNLQSQQMCKLSVRNQIFKKEKEKKNSGSMELILFQWEKIQEIINQELNTWLLGKIQRALVKVAMKEEMSISLI